MSRWVKIPGAGEYRGEGEWVDYEDYCHSQGYSDEQIRTNWNYLRNTNYLPSKEQEDKPV